MYSYNKSHEDKGMRRKKIKNNSDFGGAISLAMEMGSLELKDVAIGTGKSIESVRRQRNTKIASLPIMDEYADFFRMETHELLALGRR